MIVPSFGINFCSIHYPKSRRKGGGPFDLFPLQRVTRCPGVSQTQNPLPICHLSRAWPGAARDTHVQSLQGGKTLLK